MKVVIEQISQEQDEQVVIHCCEVNEDVRSIVRFVKSTGILLTGYADDSAAQVSLLDILFVEAVDERVFAYTEAKVYELRCKLYEFASLYEDRKFFRCSKSFVINLMKIDTVRPILNGRLSATLFNGEEIIISRQYVPELKKRLFGESA